MIDFANGVFVKLKQTSPQDGMNMVQGLLIQGESIVSAYKGIRDYVVFTNKRVISVNVQGMTGKKKEKSGNVWEGSWIFPIFAAATKT